MRILIVSEFYYPHLGGITEHIYGFAKECIAKGHDVTLLTSRIGPLSPEHEIRGLKIVHLGKSFNVLSNNSFARVTLTPFLGTKLNNFLKNGNFDIVHLHSPLTPVLPILSIKYKYAPTVGTLHTSFDGSVFYQFFKKPVQEILNGLDGVISVSQSGIDSLQKYFKFNATVIPNGVDVSLFESGKVLPQFKNKPFRIFFIGRMDPRNSVGLLLDSFYILQKRKIPSHLIIAGDGPLRSYYENSVPTEYKDKVTFAGAIYKERPDFYASADAFCFPVTKACFSVTLLEAMAAGAPVVVPNIPAFASVISHGNSGLLTKAGDATSIADALQTMAEDKNGCIRMSENARLKAQEYSWEKVSDRVLNYYQQFLHSDQRIAAQG